MSDVNVRALRRSEYDLLVQAGMLDGERIELLEGRLVRVSPQGPRHAHVVQLLDRLLQVPYGSTAQIRIQLPLALGAHSEPEPDAAVVDDRVWRTHPDEAWLVVEVADTSRIVDAELKARLYAAAGIPEYWVVDLTDDQILVHTRPSADGYEDVVAVGDGQLALPGTDGTIAARRLLDW